MTIQEFLESRLHNAWCEEGSFQVYVRKGRHLLHGDIRTVLDVSSINSDTPGSGLLPELFDRIEAMVADTNLDGVYVENVMNERLRSWLHNRGYVKLIKVIDVHDQLPCYWRKS